MRLIDPPLADGRPDTPLCGTRRPESGPAGTRPARHYPGASGLARQPADPLVKATAHRRPPPRPVPARSTANA
jgi:hypothetical protein